MYVVAELAGVTLPWDIDTVEADYNAAIRRERLAAVDDGALLAALPPALQELYRLVAQLPDYGGAVDYDALKGALMAAEAPPRLRVKRRREEGRGEVEE